MYWTLVIRRALVRYNKGMEKLTLLPFELPGSIYRSPLPNSSMYDPEKEILPAYMAANITWVVSLILDSEALQYSDCHLHAIYRPRHIEVINNPVQDFSAPGHGAFDTAIRMVINQAKRGKNIAIHCHAGIGRTGMFMACLARELWGWDAEQAIAWVRTFIEGAVESEFQVKFVEEYKFERNQPHSPQSVRL